MWKNRLPLIVALALLVPLGLATKMYSGPTAPWVNGYCPHYLLGMLIGGWSLGNPGLLLLDDCIQDHDLLPDLL